MNHKCLVFVHSFSLGAVAVSNPFNPLNVSDNLLLRTSFGNGSQVFVPNSNPYAFVVNLIMVLNMKFYGYQRIRIIHIPWLVSKLCNMYVVNSPGRCCKWQERRW